MAGAPRLGRKVGMMQIDNLALAQGWRRECKVLQVMADTLKSSFILSMCAFELPCFAESASLLPHDLTYEFTACESGR